MGLLPDDVLVAPLAVRHQTQQIAHGAGRHEHSRSEAQIPRKLTLKLAYSWILPKDIIAGFGAKHCLAHLSSGLGNGIAAQIDEGH